MHARDEFVEFYNVTFCMFNFISHGVYFTVSLWFLYEFKYDKKLLTELARDLRVHVFNRVGLVLVVGPVWLMKTMVNYFFQYTKFMLD